MQKYLGAFVFGGMVGFACTTTFDPKPAARQSPAQAPAAITVAAQEPPVEQVRHMRVRKKTCELAEIPKETEETEKTSGSSGVAEQTDTVIDPTPTGSIKPTGPRKTKLLAKKSRRKTIDPQEAETEQAPPAETQSPPPRGFFEALFQGN